MFHVLRTQEDGGHVCPPEDLPCPSDAGGRRTRVSSGRSSMSSGRRRTEDTCVLRKIFHVLRTQEDGGHVCPPEDLPCPPDAGGRRTRVSSGRSDMSSGRRRTEDTCVLRKICHVLRTQEDGGHVCPPEDLTCPPDAGGRRTRVSSGRSDMSSGRRRTRVSSGRSDMSSGRRRTEDTCVLRKI